MEIAGLIQLSNSAANETLILCLSEHHQKTKVIYEESFFG
jgi:hypothetical protein